MLTEPRPVRTVTHRAAPADAGRTVALRNRGAASLTVFAVLAVVTAARLLDGQDKAMDRALNRFALAHSGVTDFFKAVTHLGEPTVTLGAGLAVAAVFWLLRLRNSAYFAAATVIGVYAIAYVAKKAVHRHRPVFDAAHTVATDTGASFPSGHATGTSALVAVLILAALPWIAADGLRRGLAVVLVASTALIVVSRPVLGVHYPTDVVAGFFLGTGWALVCASASRPWRDRASAG